MGMHSGYQMGVLAADPNRAFQTINAETLEQASKTAEIQEPSQAVSVFMSRPCLYAATRLPAELFALSWRGTRHTSCLRCTWLHVSHANDWVHQHVRKLSALGPVCRCCRCKTPG